MAAWPVTGRGVWVESSRTSKRSNLVDRAADGSAKGLSMFAGAAYAFVFKERFLTLAQVDERETFYAANRLLQFDIVWKNGVTHTVIFAGAPPHYDLYRAGYFEGEMTCESVQAA